MLPRCQFNINVKAYYSSDISDWRSPSKRNETHLPDDRLHRRSVCIICSRYNVESNLFHVVDEIIKYLIQEIVKSLIIYLFFQFSMVIPSSSTTKNIIFKNSHNGVHGVGMLVHTKIITAISFGHLRQTRENQVAIISKM